MKLFLCQAAKHSCLRIRTASDADANSVISRTSGTSVQCGPTDQIGLLWRHQVAAIGSARTGNGMGATGWCRPTARSRSARRAATTALTDISDPVNHLRWQKIEASKRRLVYSLINLNLPLPGAASGDVEPLVFNFLASPSDPAAGPKVMTGHESGVITISLAEADDTVPFVLSPAVVGKLGYIDDLVH